MPFRQSLFCAGVTSDKGCKELREFLSNTSIVKDITCCSPQHRYPLAYDFDLMLSSASSRWIPGHIMTTPLKVLCLSLYHCTFGCIPDPLDGSPDFNTPSIMVPCAIVVSVSPPPSLSSKLSIRLVILPAFSNRHSAVLSIILLSSTPLLLLVDGGCHPPPCRPLPLLDLVEFTLFAPG